MYVYILKTLNDYPSRYYVGVTSNLKQRIIDHNQGKSNAVLHSDALTAIISLLDNFNFKQAYHFQTNKYDGVKINELVHNNKELYSAVPICFLSGEQDTVTSHR